MKRKDVFSAIRSEGGLLTSDLLQRIADGDPKLGGIRPQDYHLAPNERINEVVNRSWNRLTSVWSSFQKGIQRLSESESDVSITREKWLLFLFQELGYGWLRHSRSVSIDEKTYPISHFWQDVPIHLIGFRMDLDKRTPGAIGAARSSPHSLIQEYLNRNTRSLWGFVSNGQLLRIVRNNASLTRQTYLEFDLEAIFDGESFSDFVLLWMICHQSRVEAEHTGESWLEKWVEDSQQRPEFVKNRRERGASDSRMVGPSAD